MKKAYNVYFNFERTFVKAAMLTSLFALCFLFAGEISAQAHMGGVEQPDFATAAGVSVPTGALTNNVEDLDEDLIENEAALEIVKNLYSNLVSKADAAANASPTDEIEHALRTTFLSSLATQLKMESEFGSAFTYATTNMTLSYANFDESLYTGPSLNAIAEGYILNFK